MADLTISSIRARGQLGTSLVEPYPIWPPFFQVDGRFVKDSDSLYESHFVASAIVTSITKATDAVEHAQKSSPRLRLEAFRNFLKIIL